MAKYCFIFTVYVKNQVTSQKNIPMFEFIIYIDQLTLFCVQMMPNKLVSCTDCRMPSRNISRIVFLPISTHACWVNPGYVCKNHAHRIHNRKDYRSCVFLTSSSNFWCKASKNIMTKTRDLIEEMRLKQDRNSRRRDCESRIKKLLQRQENY